MPVLYRKLQRELWHLRSQVLAIALVVGGGVAVWMMALVSYSSLNETRDQYYRSSRFADVFVDLTRAPQRLLQQVQELDGVAQVESRLQAGAQLSLENFSDPVSARVLSLPDQGEPLLNRLHLSAGRLPDSRRDNEVVVIGSFADAHELAPGDALTANINGRLQSLRVVGVAESSEFIYVIPPGSMLPDYHRYAILWMARRPLAAALDMEGAFNSVLVKVTRSASVETLVDHLDQIFRPYGSTGAYSRADQFSNRFLDEELKQLRTMALIFPAIFMSVAMFLINVVISRLIATQRDVIAVLKAFGYSNAQVGVHYGLLVGAIMLLGILLGLGVGLWLGDAMAVMYMQYFRFPDLLFEVPLLLTVAVSLLSLLAGWGGAWGALSRAFRLAPAAALGPEPAPRYRRMMLERLWPGLAMGQLTRMLMRGLERRPSRTLFSVLGVAFATAIVVLGTFQFDSVNLMVHVQFQRAQQEDITVALVQPRSQKVVHELAAIPGVRYAEGSLTIPVRLHSGHRSWRVALTGLSASSRLSRRIDTQLQDLPLPEEGLVLTDFLLEELALAPGDAVMVEWLDGSGRHTSVPVVAGSREFIGLGAWMSLPALQRLYGRGEQVNQLQATIDPSARQSVLDALVERPLVAGVSERSAMLDAFYETLGKTFLTFTFVNSLLGGVIAFGVVYNTVRISLAERGRELASLRVLGYRPWEVDHILLAELALLLLLGVPLGWLIGQYLGMLMMWLMQSELYRAPLLITGHTLGLSATVVLVSALLSSWVAVRRVARLDLVQVLKTRE